MNEKYCHKCGQELIKAEIDRYDLYTGEPIYDMKCPTNLCEHYGVYHMYKGIFMNKCIKCHKYLSCPY